MMEFSERRVLVTGGTRGIGRAAVEGFLAAGASVAVNGRTPESVARAIGELGAGDRLVAAPGDTASAAGCRAVVEAAGAGLGGLDVLVNNAGSGGGGPVGDLEEALWDRVVDTNLKGTFFCTKYALPALRERGGAVVNIASVRAVMGAAGASIYCASKGGVVAMTKAMAIEFAPAIRVNALLPGAIDTDMLQALAVRMAGEVEKGYAMMSAGTPLGRVARRQEMADAILYLASPRSTYITGAALLADGGMAAGSTNLDQKAS
ncbi:MAG: SDR family NAD(P)-dependent oxidoreductase [Proteobacteria bacterium]|nr:SDR family NAD(P)-dependent oxidoreductase [Pseudomonadota bacterium]